MKQIEPTRAVGYVRVSTDEQVQGFSLEGQAERIRSYAESQDYSLECIYRDDGYSAKDLNRPDIQRLLADVASGSVDVVLVYKLDRLSRRLRDLTEVLDLLTKHGTRFESVTEPFETKSAPGRLMLNVLGGFAQFEREVNGERVLLAMERRFREGKWMVQPPYGYRMVDGLLVVEPAEAMAVRRLFTRYLGDGLGVKDLAREMNAEGHRTRRGGPWRPSSLHRLLTNRAYLGRVVWRGQERAGTHEPLVGEDLFEAVQQKLRARRQSPPRRLASENLLVGLARCGRCGASMFVQRPGNAAKRHYRYYACANRVQDRSCGQPYIPAGRLEGAVIGKLVELADHPTRIRPFLSREIRQRRVGRQELERRVKALDHEIAHLETHQREMVEWLAETLPGKAAARKLNEKIEAVEQQKNALAEERATLRGRLAAGDLASVTAESVAGHLARFGDYFERFNAGQRKELMEAVVQTVTVEGPARARVRFSLPTAPLARFDQSLDGDLEAGSKYRVRWRPQRDSNPCCHLERVES